MTRSLRHRLALLVALLAGAACAVGPAGLALGQDRPGDTSATAINTKDGSSVFKLAFEIRRVTGDVVDNQNTALAYSSCKECQTVAISIQVLLVAGSPSTFTPQNVAVAINENCSTCKTMALAYQFAVGMTTEMRFTRRGIYELVKIRRDLDELQRSNLSIEEIKARADEIVARLKDVLANELVPVRPGDEHGNQDEQLTGPDHRGPPGDTTGTGPSATTPLTQSTTPTGPADATQTAPDATTTATTPATTTTAPAPAQTTPATTTTTP
jgi:putative peptide zinc metalloprotease protein